ncbi:MAG: hypothetical protein RL701_2240, partial [Pseudomonadota bacterium]
MSPESVIECDRNTHFIRTLMHAGEITVSTTFGAFSRASLNLLCATGA